jgi:hypothetical protein
MSEEKPDGVVFRGVREELMMLPLNLVISL